MVAQSAKNQILDTARTMFAAYGYEATKVDAICEESGINKRILYSFFRTKDELYSTVLSEAARDLEQKFLTQVLPCQNDVQEAWKAFLQLMVTQKTALRIWAWEALGTSMSGMWILMAVQKLASQMCHLSGMDTEAKDRYKVLRIMAIAESYFLYVAAHSGDADKQGILQQMQSSALDEILALCQKT